MDNRIIVGLTTRVVLFGEKGKREVIGRVDTGATKSSIDLHLAKELGMGPEFKHAKVKSAHGVRHRPVILVSLAIAGELMEVECTIADREHMKYKFLIGQNVLKKGFLIDPTKKA